MEVILFCGPSGSGKSFRSKELEREKNYVRLSSDENRARLGTGEEDQSVSRQAFELMEKELRENLSQGKSVILDATFTHRKARKPFISIAREFGAKIIAICLTTSSNLCKSRNSGRERTVPEWVIDKQFGQLAFPDLSEVNEVRYE
jgi:protein phosphatase